jgi:dihydroxyacetone kinase-like predicted kinase
MTVLVGAQAPPRAGDVIMAHIRERSPLTDVTVYDGGQADHPVIIGVE